VRRPIDNPAGRPTATSRASIRRRSELPGTSLSANSRNVAYKPAPSSSSDTLSPMRRIFWWSISSGTPAPVCASSASESAKQPDCKMSLVLLSSATLKTAAYPEIRRRPTSTTSEPAGAVFAGNVPIPLLPP
jgi:hypothetical protein